MDKSGLDSSSMVPTSEMAVPELEVIRTNSLRKVNTKLRYEHLVFKKFLMVSLKILNNCSGNSKIIRGLSLIVKTSLVTMR